MNDCVLLTGLFPILYPLVHILVFISMLLTPTKEAPSQVTWIVVILALPFLGIILYVLLGETNIGRKRVEQIRELISGYPDVNHFAQSQCLSTGCGTLIEDRAFCREHCKNRIGYRIGKPNNAHFQKS